MHYNADARAEFLEILGQTRDFLQQQMAAGRRQVTLRPGTWEALAAAVERSAAPPPAARPSGSEALPLPGSAPDDPLAAYPTLDALAAFTSDCTQCGLCEGRRQVVFGVGNPDAKVVFVGEAPGADEDRQGEPFVGRAGQLLTRIIETMLEPWTRADVYICNVIKCRPPDNRDPLPAEIEACEPYLLRQLELLRPALIITLGKFAAQTLLREHTGMMKLRGRWREYHGIPLMPVLHPAYVLRNQTEGRRMMFEDMKLVRARLTETGLL